MKTYSNTRDLQSALRFRRNKGRRIGFVPTMGNLHEGHIELVHRAQREADVVVVSIFVNPLQFGANEDLDAYPRTLEADKEKLIAAGAHLLFTPTVDIIYPEGMERHSKVHVPEITNTLCGASRPGHFDGVTTVVNKLFNIVQPDVAIFGNKDFQQVAVIRKMVEDLCMPIDIIGESTVRADDGLALSSRNGYLNSEQRDRAPRLYQLLREIRTAIVEGYDSFDSLQQYAIERLQTLGFTPDYFAIRDARTLMDVTEQTEKVVILVAARLGSTRLIDNVTVNLKQDSEYLLLATN